MELISDSHSLHYNYRIMHYVPEMTACQQRPPTLMEYEYDATLTEVREHDALHPSVGLFSRFSAHFTSDWGGFFVNSGNHSSILLAQRRYPQTREHFFKQ